MQLACPCCGTEYVVPVRKSLQGVFTVICSHCSFKWRREFTLRTSSTFQRNQTKKDEIGCQTTTKTKPNYRKETLDILREEATIEARLRGL